MYSKQYNTSADHREQLASSREPLARCDSFEQELRLADDDGIIVAKGVRV